MTATLRCPFCGAETQIDPPASKPTEVDGGKQLRRRRRCIGIHRHVFFSRERPEAGQVRKDGGSVEPFDRDKLERGISRAANKRPVADAVIRSFVDEISTEVWERRVVETREIGERALALLQEHDTVAYIRFLSVYRDFDSLDQFREALERLTPSLQVRKGGGRTEPFDRGRLLSTLQAAAAGRGRVSYDALLGIVEDVCASADDRWISSAQIHEQVSLALRRLDEIAFLRFESMYGQFTSIEEFLQVLHSNGAAS